MRILILLLPLTLACASAPPTWAELHARPTTLLRKGPAPHAFKTDPPSYGEALRYPSGANELLAYWAKPEGAGPHPVLLYVHRGFSLKQKDFDLLQPFVDDGFAVFAPSFRGENGNPGDFELWKGELDDLLAAIDWLQQRPDVDAARIHAFGHSAGGGLVTLLTLLEEPRLATYASSNGVYTSASLGRWSQKTNEDLVRFDPADMDERRARVLLENVDEMKHALIAYCGDKDTWTLRNTAEAIRAAKRNRIEMKIVPGSHGPSQEPALEDLRARLKGL